MTCDHRGGGAFDGHAIFCGGDDGMATRMEERGILATFVTVLTDRWVIDAADRTFTGKLWRGSDALP